MKPTGKQIKSLQTALLAAFDHARLRQMLSAELEQNLEQIAPVTNANLTDIVYNVIRHYAAQPGGLHTLIRAARADNPDNQELAQVGDQLLAVEFDPLPVEAKPSVTIDKRLLGAAIVVLLLAIAGVIYYLNLPKPMGPGYNVAVAGFSTLSATGDSGSTDSGPSDISLEISDWFFSAVENEMAQLPSTVRHEVRGPDEVGPIRGATPAARAEAAQKKADDFDAAVLIYGVVSEKDGQWYVQPEFYVNDQDTFFYAVSLIGPNQLGAPIPFTLPLEPGQQVEVNRALDARRQVLQHAVVGLGHFFADEYERAQLEFRTAANIPDWPDDAGKEIMYILIAAAALRQYDRIAAPEPLDDAERAFGRAYEINPAFARAHVGLGTVAVQRAAQLDDQATGGDNPAANQLPAATADQPASLLVEAQAWFEASLVAADQQPSDYIAIKANYGLGQVNLLGGQYRVANYSLDQARKFYDAVLVNVANANFDYLNRFAAQTHAALGLIAGLEGDYARAATEYRTANAIWAELPAGKSDLTLARNWAMIGAVEQEQQNYCAAEEAYTQAVMLGEEIEAAKEEVAKWQEFNDRIKQQGLCSHES